MTHTHTAKSLLLTFYDYLIPKSSYTRYKLYNHLLWKYFPDPIDYFLIQFSKMKNDGVLFVQIGAHDGKTLDQVRKHILRSNWKGLFIEPDLKAFNILKKNYQRHDGRRFLFENVAIDREKGERWFYYIDEKNVPLKHNKENIFKLVSSFSKMHVKKETERFGSIPISKKKVKCETLNEIVKKHNIRNANLVAIDAEGHDWEIIKSIDLTEFKPELILFEISHLSYYDLMNSKDVLVNEGYLIIMEQINALAFRRDYLSLVEPKFRSRLIVN